MILLAVFLAACSDSLAEEHKKFSFVVMADSQAVGGASAGFNDSVLGTLIDRIKAEQADFLIFLGDMVTSSNAGSLSELNGYFASWKKMSGSSGIPVYVSVGNHDVDAYGAQAEDLIRKEFAMPYNGPQGLKGLAYYFDFSGARFIVLDTSERDGGGFIGAKQAKWLKEVLNGSGGRDVFVFGHCPVFEKGDEFNRAGSGVSEGKDRIWGMFLEHGVRLYFCGHEHRFRGDLYGGIRQIVSSGAGGPFDSRFPEHESYYHYCLVSVDPDNGCLIEVKDINGKTVEKITDTGR